MGYRIKEAREEAGMTQDELANKSGVSRSIINGLETGRATVTTNVTLLKIAKALDKRIADIFLTTRFNTVNTERSKLLNELIKTHENENGELEVSGRELHEFLEVKTAYKDWFPRMAEYGFNEGQDFCSKMSESTGGRPGTDHSMTITMAKELCMLQRTDKGKQARQYFLQLEQAWNTPEMIMSRALKMADQTINGLKADNVKLTVQNTIMAPKAEYFDDLVDRNLLTGVRETAKELKVKERPFVSFLLEKKYLYRDQKGKLRPFAGHSDLFELKETMNEKTGWVGTQLLITPKGRETFRLLMI